MPASEMLRRMYRIGCGDAKVNVLVLSWLGLEPVNRVVHGPEMLLPDSMIALQLLIGFLPFSFVNSVTQYVLIAIDQQRFLTKAFLIGVGFNVAANLVAIPLWSYKGAAVVTILSEFALLVPFYYSVRKHLGPLPWPSLVWQPAVASAVIRWGSTPRPTHCSGCVPWNRLSCGSIQLSSGAADKETVPAEPPAPAQTQRQGGV